jgi:large subunit ribosomal protein L7/L12
VPLPDSQAQGDGDEASSPAALYDVILVEAGPRKVNVIKQVLAQSPELGLAGAKGLVDSAPSRILSQATWDRARAAKELIESEGAFVDMKPCH